MRNFKLEARIRRVVGNRSLPSTFSEIYSRLPRPSTRELKETLASMVSRGSLVIIEDRHGVVRYTTASKWGGCQS